MEGGIMEEASWRRHHGEGKPPAACMSRRFPEYKIALHMFFRSPSGHTPRDKKNNSMYTPAWWRDLRGSATGYIYIYIYKYFSGWGAFL